MIGIASRSAACSPLVALAASLLLVSCATLRAPIPPPVESVPVFAQPEDCAPVWTPLAAGLDFFAFSVERPRLEVRALRVDLSAPGVSVVVAGEPVGPSTTLGRKTTTFLRDTGSVAAVNGTPFAPSSAIEGERRVLTGLCVSGGVPISPPDARYAALVFRKDGSASVAAQGNLGDLGSIENAVGGFFVVLERGAPLGHPERRYARTAAGVGSSGSSLYLLVVDGRRSASVGATEPETGLLLARLGAVDGLILDGGGSTAMAVRDAAGGAFLANIPTHGFFPGRERAVANALCVLAGR